MLSLLFPLLLAAAPASQAADTAAAYEVVLAAVQREFPDRGLVLMNPRVGDRSGADGGLRHPPARVERFRGRGLIVASCVPPENTIGCGPSFREPAGPTLKLALFPLRPAGDDAEVRVTMVRVSEGGHLYVEQWIYTLREREGGWELAGCRPGAIS